MPQNTPNLSLVTYDLTLDAGVYFSTFRSTLAGYTNSALTKIDTWAGQVNADLATLKQSPSIIRVSATKDSDFVYSATVTNMTQYSLNQYINLSLSADNVGTVSLNINALGGKSLLKFNNAGTLVNISAKDLRQGKNNLFTYNGTAWVWVNAISSDQLNIAGTSGNLVKISADNTLEDSGTTFSNSVTNNAIVQRTATGQIKGAVAVANDDVVNKTYADTIDNKIGLLSALETVDKTSVVGAINENFGHIGDLSTLTTTEKTNLVGATNEVNSAIGQNTSDLNAHKAESANKAHGGFKGAIARITNNQSIVDNTLHIIPFDGVIYDTSEIWNQLNPTRLTVPIGVTKIRLIGQIEWQYNATGERRVDILRNGAAVAPYPIYAMFTAGVSGQQLLSPVISVNPGDYFEFRIRQNSGGALNLLNNVSRTTWFAMEVVE